MISGLLILAAASAAADGQRTVPQPSQRELPVFSSGSTDQSANEERERRFVAHRAAELIAQGKCGEARKLALEQRDLDSAAKIAVICSAH